MTTKNTTELLARLRALMVRAPEWVSAPLHAYIVPSGDAHISEYIAKCDERRPFISGFTGSAGTAIVTTTKAALWTDGRYYLQASAQLDSNWTLMKDGLQDTPTQADWLIKELPANGRVGVDPFMMGEGVWELLSRRLSAEGHSLVPVDKNLIDAVWDNKPERSLSPAFVHPMKYAGKLWEDKVADIHIKMCKKEAVLLVVAALDDVAWLLNLRGNDISFNPVFFSYVILTADSLMLFIDERKLSPEVKAHLKSAKVKVEIKPYESILSELKALVDKLPTGKFWISDKTNYALVSAVPKKRRLAEPSPIPLMKSVKNPVELEGMRNAHVKDAMALCEFFAWLEQQVPHQDISEIAAADKSEEFRKQQEDYVSLSFGTISAVGSNGSIIHYQPSPETNKIINLNELFLLDSGAQYRDGTTDVTRTVHLGQPTEHERECFTRVLKGHISLCSVVFPNEIKGVMLDSFARRALWEAGLDYRHGTGHGVGSFLNVHEGPCGIGMGGGRMRPDESFLEKGMVLSDEPGYYEDNKFGIRIESLVEIVDAKTKHNFNNKGFLTFNPITLVPLQAKLINVEMLSSKELDWVNDYHAKCLSEIGPKLKAQGRTLAYDWLVRETRVLSPVISTK